MINGESGADRIIGNRGDDTLKGAAGFDRLVGGKGKDACYSGPNGATRITCEDADLHVRIFAPGSADEGEAILYKVVVRNIGAKPSADFHIIIGERHLGADCGVELSLNEAFPSLVPGALVFWTTGHGSGCDITGGNPRLRIDAHVNQPGEDVNTSNDADTDRVFITAP
jgi:hypothetical protein